MADTSATISGYALKDPKGKFEPWTYHPRPVGDDDCEVKIQYCGICASDIHTAFGGWGHVEYPIIVGHEIVGTVSAVGKNVKNVKVGDRVGCGAQCGSCLNQEGKKCKGCPDHENQCSVHNIGTYNAKYNDGERTQGGYADAKRFHARWAFKIPDNIPSAEAAPLLCAGATVYTPLARFKAGKGKKVGIVGIGGLGHLGVQFAAKMGAEVIAIGRSPNKAEQAKKLGATEYITLDDEKVLEEHKVRSITPLRTASHTTLTSTTLSASAPHNLVDCLVSLFAVHHRHHDRHRQRKGHAVGQVSNTTHTSTGSDGRSIRILLLFYFF